MNDQPKWRFLAYFDSVQKIAVAVGAVVTLIGGIVSLAYLLWPNPSPPPPPRNATMTITDTFPGTKFRDFLIETGQDQTGYSEAELEQLGNEYYVNVTVDGLRDKSAGIVWNLRGDLAGLPGNERRHWIHQFLTSFRPPADSYARTAKVWIQFPPFEGKFFAVIEMEYPEYETLVAIRTKPFAGREMQPRERARPATVTRTITTVTTIPASTTTAVTTIEGTTTAVTTTEATTTEVTTIDGTTTTSTATIPTTSTVTITRTSTATIPITIPAATTTITTATTQTLATTVPAHVPIVRPTAEIVSP